jgi:hypothetical protein
MPLIWNEGTTICMRCGFVMSWWKFSVELHDTDIDECARPADYPCRGKCKNFDGHYKCDCGTGYKSNDPYKESCTPIIPLPAQISIGTITELISFQCIPFDSCCVPQNISYFSNVWIAQYHQRVYLLEMGWMMNGRFFIISFRRELLLPPVNTQKKSLKVNEIYNCLLSYDYTALQYHIWSNLYLTY